MEIDWGGKFNYTSCGYPMANWQGHETHPTGHKTSEVDWGGHDPNPNHVNESLLSEVDWGAHNPDADDPEQLTGKSIQSFLTFVVQLQWLDFTCTSHYLVQAYGSIILISRPTFMDIYPYFQDNTSFKFPSYTHTHTHTNLYLHIIMHVNTRTCYIQHMEDLKSFCDKLREVAPINYHLGCGYTRD